MNPRIGCDPIRGFVFWGQECFAARFGRLHPCKRFGLAAPASMRSEALFRSLRKSNEARPAVIFRNIAGELGKISFVIQSRIKFQIDRTVVGVHPKSSNVRVRKIIFRIQCDLIVCLLIQSYHLGKDPFHIFPIFFGRDQGINQVGDCLFGTDGKVVYVIVAENLGVFGKDFVLFGIGELLCLFRKNFLGGRFGGFCGGSRRGLRCGGGENQQEEKREKELYFFMDSSSIFSDWLFGVMIALPIARQAVGIQIDFFPLP